jgi:hypothetical protein
MRRVLSITTILVLLCSIMSPLMAACTETGKVASCHAEPAPHCDRVMQQHHHHDAAPPTESIAAGVSEANCPMDCCAPSHRQTAAASDASSTLPPLAVSDQNFHFVSVTFTSAGFSSHTDRGPPRA